MARTVISFPSSKNGEFCCWPPGSQWALELFTGLAQVGGGCGSFIEAPGCLRRCLFCLWWSSFFKLLSLLCTSDCLIIWGATVMQVWNGQVLLLLLITRNEGQRINGEALNKAGKVDLFYFCTLEIFGKAILCIRKGRLGPGGFAGPGRSLDDDSLELEVTGGPWVSTITSRKTMLSLRSVGLAVTFCRNNSVFEIISVVFVINYLRVFCEWTERSPERWALMKRTQLLSGTTLLGMEPRSRVFRDALDGPHGILSTIATGRSFQVPLQWYHLHSHLLSESAENVVKKLLPCAWPCAQY